ncbi:cyclodeaminase/cyclohydrolase family protein [Bacillus sp. FJAT-29937]|uniref:cyclodeaminase/cyclohydrolase family protein n=1 Tax=Bacillus sp. FJAT-29937 TaxID=1720553 RepID=UPI00082EC94B|nr:cyclodeaminase/cyclohydrolase family protein [Bacillus sp. FJAT-29937]
MNHIDSLTVHEYLEKLAAPDFPGPASGSAAATVAAMAAALLEMSCKVTIRKGCENIPISLKHIEDVRNQCLALATDDMKTLAVVVKAAKLKADYPDEHEEAMKNATNTLASVVKNCEEILTGVDQFFHLSDKRVIGELAGSANMAETAAASAKHGVKVNLSLIQDEFFKENVWNIVRESYQNSNEMKQRIERSINRY